MHAPALISSAADGTCVIRSEERAHDELTGLDPSDPATDLLDDATVLVPHRRRLATPTDATVRPEVRPAYAGGRQPEDGVRRFNDLWFRPLLEAHITCPVENCSAHD